MEKHDDNTPHPPVATEHPAGAEFVPVEAEEPPGVFFLYLHKAASKDFDRWYTFILCSAIGLALLGNAIFNWLDISTSARVINFVIGGFVLWFGYSITFAQARRAPGLHGAGIRPLKGECLEHVAIAPHRDASGTSADARSATTAKSVQKWSGRDLTILVNILQTEERGWMLGNIVVTRRAKAMEPNFGQPLVTLNFIKMRNPLGHDSHLYISSNGAMSSLNTATLEQQCYEVSRRLKQTGAQLQLTFTSMEGYLIARQPKTNSLIHEGKLPVPSLAPLIRDFGYEVVANENVSRFRGW